MHLQFLEFDDEVQVLNGSEVGNLMLLSQEGSSEDDALIHTSTLAARKDVELSDDTRRLMSCMTQHQHEQFRFHLYLTKVLVDRLADMMNISGLTWILVLLFVVVLMGAVVISGSSWQVLLGVWVSMGWLIFLGIQLYHCKLRSQLKQLTHRCGGLSLIKAGDWQDDEQAHGRRSRSSAIATRPHYMYTEPVQKSCWPEWMLGTKGRECRPGEQQMLNIMLFGRNEVHFQLSVLRFTSLMVSIHMSVFAKVIIGYYASSVYSAGWLALIIIVAVLPMVQLTVYGLWQVAEDAVQLTCVEHMRVRKDANLVARISRELYSVCLLKLATVLLTDGYLTYPSENNVAEAERALAKDVEHQKNGEPEVEVEQLICKRLGERTAESIICRLLKLFDVLDDEKQGCLPLEDIKRACRLFGFCPDDLGGYIYSALANSGTPSNMTKDAAPSNKGWNACVNKPTPSIQKHELIVKKSFFLAWLIHFEDLAMTQSNEYVANTWFEALDPASTGYVSIGELQNSLVKMGHVFAHHETTSLLLELDVDDTGYFDRRAMVHWLITHSRFNVNPGACWHNCYC